MSLSCECNDGYSFFYHNPDDYSALDTSRRKRCCSCEELIDVGAVALKFYSWRNPRDHVEENIYGDGGEVPIAPKWMCEECGDMYFSLDELGFCINIVEGMRDLIAEYHRDYLNERL